MTLMRRLLAPLLLALVALAGCAERTGELDRSGRPTGTGTETGAADGEGILLSGYTIPFDGGFVANVSAYNDGPDTYGVGRSYCVSNYGAWTARLDGPPGEDLVYRNPNENQLGCPGQTGIPMPPGTFVNWTFSGDWGRARCDTRYVCDNVWDGDLFQPDGQRSRAPAGTYTWRFTFTYSVGASGGTPHVEREGIDFTVELQP